MSPDPYAELDRELPLALLPVRLEARYLPRDNPTHLVVRIFPDEIHADAHAEALTEREERAGHTYWQAVWDTDDPTVMSTARQWLAGQCGPYRALWVATATTPTGRSDDGALIFPEVPRRQAPEPTRARLLPDRWMVRLYDRQLKLVHTVLGAPVPDGLPMAPSLAAIDPEKVGSATDRDPLSAFLAGQGLGWMIDPVAAERVGMAVRIPIADVPTPVGALIVSGVRADRDPVAEAAELDELVAAHWYTRGFDIVPQGTPTNNSDAGRSGVSVASPDVDELFERESSRRPLAPGGRALLMAADPALMYRLPAADTLSLALGRLRTNTFDRTSHAENLDGLAGWAMNLAIGFATLGDYLDGPLAKRDGRTATGAHTPALRDWYVDWVRGAAPLPVIRCGAQPYGLLPITTPVRPDPDAVDFRGRLAHHLARLATTWRRSLPTAALDPDATDARPPGTAAADAVVVGEVLGAVPHPTSFQLRVAEDNSERDTAALFRAVGQVDFDVMREPVSPGTPAGELVQLWRATKPTIDGVPNDLVPDASIPDIHTQLANAEAFRDALADGVDELAHGEEALAHLENDLLPRLERHRDATERVPPQLAEFNESAGLGSPAAIRLVHTTFRRRAEPVHHLVTSNGDLTELATVLDELITSLDAVVEQQLDTWSRPRVVRTAAPLLHHLLERNYLQVPIEDARRVRAALEVLRAGVNSTTGSVTEAVVERVLRESLGVGIHRIDAWITSLASERLATLRRARPAGLQIGGYGWLLDLSPSDDPPSQGFIHAPSLSHAATAGVLRSGWSAFGTESGETPLSVDLSSPRVRGGTWILDGVRNGQDLAETLGARLERYLHDAHLDEWIETLRQIVLDVTGSAEPPIAVVDGLLVARASSDLERTPVENQLRAALAAATAPTGDPDDDRERSAVRGALRRLAADLDSVADLTMAQSVHSLLRGNMDASAGALAVTGGGDAAVPPITVTASQRDAQVVSYRVVAVWPVDGPPAASASVIGVAEPRLTGWLESLLPPPEQVGARAGGGRLITLADVGLTAVEAAVLAGAGESQAGSRLGRLVAALAGGEVDLNDGPAGGMSVDEFGLLAAVAVDAIGRGRALRAADLVVPGGDASQGSEDALEIEDRLNDVQERFDDLAVELAADDAAVVRTALLRAAALGVPGAVSALEAGTPPDVVAQVAAALGDRRVASGAGVDDTTVDGMAEHIRRLVNGAVPILPVFTPAPDPARAVSEASERRRAEVADAGHRWLRQVARVRSAVGALNELLLLAEASRGAPLASLGLIQLPHHEEGWVAIGPPAGPGERLAILSLTGSQALAASDQPIAGFVVDSWSDSIPRRDQLTGIAVHFDAPTARAPNAVLLSVADDAGFSAAGISEQLLDVIRLMKLRAIPPTGIVEHGHYLPTTFLPEDIELPEVAS